MFKRKTLFVVGAGAGLDLKMPLGGPLSTKIADSLRFEFDDSEQLFRPLSIRKIKHGEGRYGTRCTLRRKRIWRH